MKMSIIVPCYNSMPILETMVGLIKEVTDQMEAIDDLEVILANDCSPNPETVPFLKKIADEYHFVKVVDMAVNSGQANTQVAALNFTTGDVVISMDDDMQTHPKNIPLLFNKLMEGYDVVMARYPKKRHVFYRRMLTKMDDWFEHVFLGRPKGLDFNSFWIARKYIVDEVIKYHAPYSYMEGLFLRSAGKIGNVDVEHFERTEGHSGYNLGKLVQLWSNFTGFTIKPLRLIGVLGIIISAAAFIYAVVLVVRRLMGLLVAGYASLMCIMLLFFGFTFIFLSILGEYIGRIFMAINATPQYVVKEIYTADQKNQKE